jgi:hypothetical protein
MLVFIDITAKAENSVQMGVAFCDSIKFLTTNLMKSTKQSRATNKTHVITF